MSIGNIISSNTTNKAIHFNMCSMFYETLDDCNMRNIFLYMTKHRNTRKTVIQYSNNVLFFSYMRIV